MPATPSTGRRHALALLWAAVMPTDTSAAATPPLELQPLAVPDAARISALALIADPQPRLVLAREPLPLGRRLELLPLAAPEGGAPAVLAGFLHPAAWSVAPAAAGKVQIVATDNSSAGSGLRWQSPGRDAVVSHLAPFEVFDLPAFVRPARAAPAALTAVALLDGAQRPVLFLPQADAGFAAPRPLPMPRPGQALAVRLLRLGAGFLQATLLGRPGVRPRHRTPDAAGELVQGGWLECQWLTPGLQPAGEAWRPFGDETVWEFDADVTGERAVLVASVDGGLALAVGVAGAGMARVLHARSAAALLSPAVVAAGPVLHIVALAAAATPQAAVLAGTLPLD